MINKAILTINLSEEEILQYYQGQASYLQVEDQQGRWIRLPLNHLRPFVTAKGVYGVFCMEYDDQHRIRNFYRKPAT